MKIKTYNVYLISFALHIFLIVKVNALSIIKASVYIDTVNRFLLTQGENSHRKVATRERYLKSFRPVIVRMLVRK